MDRDKTLFMVIGLLAGFICGYVMHEFMAARQPAPGWATTAGNVSPSRPGAAGQGAAGQPGQGAAGQPGQGAPGGAAAGGGPAMAQVQQLAAHVRENPEDANAVRQLADLNYDISNWQRAADLYEQYLKLNAADIDVMTDLGATYRHLGKQQEALEQFRNVRKLQPNNWQSRYNEVLILAFDMDDLPAANTALAELVSMQPENPEVARLAAALKKRAQGA